MENFKGAHFFPGDLGEIDYALDKMKDAHGPLNAANDMVGWRGSQGNAYCEAANEWIRRACSTVSQVYKMFCQWGETSRFRQHSWESTGSFFHQNKWGFSSGLRVSLLPFLLLIFIGGFSVGSALTIHVSNPVVVYLPATSAILPCRVEHADNEKGRPEIIRWERGPRDGESVFWRTSTGGHFPADKYRNVKLGEGCTLIIPNPNTTLTGVYTVTVDVFVEVSESVHLIVLNKTASMLSTTTTAHGGCISEAVGGKSSQGEDRVWTTYLTVAVSLGFVAILIGTVFIAFVYRRQRLTRLVFEEQLFPPNRKETLMPNGIGNIESLAHLLRGSGAKTI